MSNAVSTKVKIDSKEYVDGVKKMAQETKQTTTDIDKSLHKSEGAWNSYENAVKMTSAGIKKAVEFAKQGLADLGKATLIGAGAFAGSFVKNSMTDAAKSMLNFGEAMSRVRLKTGMAKKDLNDLQNSISELASTGAELGSLPDAFDEIFSATNDVGKSTKVMESVAKFASGTESGDASQVAKFVRTNLTSQGKEVNSLNANSLLDSVASMVKTGAFKNLDEAMSSFGGIDANAMGISKMSSKSVAAMLSASSPIGNKEQSIAAINELIKGSANGFEKNYALRGMLGGNNPFKNGQIDPDALIRASKAFKARGVDDAGNRKLLMESGMSEGAANGLMNILKHADKFKDGIKKFNDGATSADKVVDTLNDNAAGKLKKAAGGIKAMTSEIVNDLSSLDFSSAGKHLYQHKGDAALAGGALAAGGLLSMGALKTIVGIFKGGSGTGGFAGGLGKMAGLEGIGVPVRVMNWDDQSKVSKALDSVTSSKDMIKSGGSIASVLGMAGKAVRVAGVGFAGYEAGQALRHFEPVKEIGDTIADGIYTALKSLGLTPDSQKEIKLEVDSKDPGLFVKPKSNDNLRSPFGN